MGHRERPEETGPGERRVLVVDDQPDAADSLALLLELCGYQTRRAYSGEEAIAIARQFLPDAVILDLRMPTLNGFEAARCITGDLLCQGARLIAVTGHADASTRELCTRLGFAALLLKPVKLEQLREALADA
jgi:two-component system, chemotaxis family, CheB/CheR fusion protein